MLTCTNSSHGSHRTAALSASIALLEADCYTVDFASDAKEFR
jgi:hypothetical protein